MPEIQSFKLAPDINICLEHRRLSDKCFAEVATKEASQQSYSKIDNYVLAWNPVLAMEAATDSIRNDDSFILQNLKVKWQMDDSEKVLVGKFQLNNEYCKTRHIEISDGDYACVRISVARSLESRSDSSGSSSEYETASEGEHSMESVSLDQEATKSFWVGHCNISVTVPKKKPKKYLMKLFQHSMEFSNILKRGKVLICTVEILRQSIPLR